MFFTPIGVIEQFCHMGIDNGIQIDDIRSDGAGIDHLYYMKGAFPFEIYSFVGACFDELHIQCNVGIEKTKFFGHLPNQLLAPLLS